MKTVSIRIVGPATIVVSTKVIFVTNAGEEEALMDRKSVRSVLDIHPSLRGLADLTTRRLRANSEEACNRK
jgi:hypothetical protein